MADTYVPGSFYFYAPNTGAAVFFTIAFLASTCVHAYQASHYKAWTMMGFFVVTGILFTAGFALRIYGSYHYDKLIPFILAIIFVYAAPPLCELANFMQLGRLLYYVPWLSPIHPGRVLSTFAGISGLIEMLNGVGASYAINPKLKPEQTAMGNAIIKTALILQLAVAVCFTVLAVFFHRRCYKNNIRNAKLDSALTTLYISIGLITVRTIYRIVEFFSIATLHFGPGMKPEDMAYILRYEGFFYGFESSIMLINTVLFNIRHPRKYLPKSKKVYLDRDGGEVLGPGYKEERNFFLTLFDPFDIIGLIQGKDKTGKFWEQQAGAIPLGDGPATDLSHGTANGVGNTNTKRDAEV